MVNALKETVNKHVKSQSYAWNGVWLIIKSQLNFRIELLVTLVVIAAGFYFKLSLIEWYGVIFSFTLVLLAEALNSSIEKACDAIMTKRHGAIRYAKDVSAGAVLFAAIAAVVVGYLVFSPYITQLVTVK
jgi:diacylglycerol kinase